MTRASISDGVAPGLIALAIFGRSGAGIVLSAICAMGIVWLRRRTRPRHSGYGGVSGYR